jgi:hypothetical protein
MRNSRAIPRASLRSVFTTMAESAALTCRVSSNTLEPGGGEPAASHCDNGPASRPRRASGRASASRNCTGALGSLATFASRTIRPPASTTHTLLCSRTRRSRHSGHGCPSMMLGADPSDPALTPSLWGQRPRPLPPRVSPLRHLSWKSEAPGPTVEPTAPIHYSYRRTRDGADFSLSEIGKDNLMPNTAACFVLDLGALNPDPHRPRSPARAAGRSGRRCQRYRLGA